MVRRSGIHAPVQTAVYRAGEAASGSSIQWQLLTMLAISSSNSEWGSSAADHWMQARVTGEVIQRCGEVPCCVSAGSQAIHPPQCASPGSARGRVSLPEPVLVKERDTDRWP